MANYTIIGGDGKEYGPITAEDIRQWITEGRLDGNSRVRSDNDTEWRSLSAFPEFASSFQSPFPSRSQPPPLGAIHRPAPPAGLKEIKNPSIALIIVGVLSILMAVCDIGGSFAPSDINQLDQATASIPAFQKLLHDPNNQKWLSISESTGVKLAEALFGLAMSVIVLVGGFRMKEGRSYEFACVAAVLAMIPCLTPCPCCVVGLPCGIWALMTLRKPGIKEQFH
jgi:hypothetical protein